jgi:formylglycine-generating enzyme required for sulfatase activity
LKAWIAQGAKWPDGVTLQARKVVTAETNDDAATIAGIYKTITAHGDTPAADMKKYTETISGSKVSFDMIPIPAGSFMMGSPASEPKRGADEGPQHKVNISAFWMEKCEVTWNEFELFMYPDSLKSTAPAGTDLADAVTHPTKPYVEMSFGMGKDGFPAISMTQHAANTYCKWLSAKTGHFYRLPTEAEWEYACRAGTTTAYSFGDDASKLGDYAWYAANSNGKYQLVGQKKPNPWGLYDMHGNVAEWTLDQYFPEGYKIVSPNGVTDPWERATQPYPQVVRGGSWMDEDPALLRSAARVGSDRSWKIQDPQLPKSIWYHTDAQFLGFRVVRPVKTPSQEEAAKYWNNGVTGE